jgi:hypothetical protein
VALGGVKALAGGPQHEIEEADLLDPATDIFQIKNISEMKIAQ